MRMSENLTETEYTEALEELTGVGRGRHNRYLTQAGVETPREVAEMGVDGLQEIDGFGAHNSQRVVKSAREVVRDQLEAELDGMDADELADVLAVVERIN